MSALFKFLPTVSFYSYFLFSSLVFAGDMFELVNRTDTHDCKVYWSEKLLPMDYERRIVCFPSLLSTNGEWKARHIKPAKRFHLETLNAKNECAQCFKEGLCDESITYDWLKVENGGLGILEVESSQLDGKLIYKYNKICDLQVVQPSKEYAYGAFLVDLLKENGTSLKNHLIFLFSSAGPYYYSEAKMNVMPINNDSSNSSTMLVTTTTEVMKSSTPPANFPGPGEGSSTIDSNLPLSYSLRLKPIYNGTKINFRAQVKDQAQSMQINLLHDAPEWHAQLGATLLQVVVDFKKYFANGQITYAAYFKDTWFGNGTWIDKNKTMFKRGETFICSMLITQIEEEKDEENMWFYYKKYIIIRIDINGINLGEFTGNMPIWSLNWMQFAGDIVPVGIPPEIEYAAAPPYFTKHELHNRLFDGAVLCVEGKAMEEKKKDSLMIFMFLFREANERSNIIGDTVLELNYFTKTGLNADSIIHETGKRGDNRGVRARVEPGKDFFALIKVLNNGLFNITWPDTRVDATTRTNLSYNDPRVIPWAANWLNVDGVTNVRVNSNSGLCAGKSKEGLPANIRQLYPNKTLVAGDKITVTGKVENPKLVEIFLLREALEWDERFGQTVLRIQIKQDIMECNSYNRKQWTLPTVSQIPLDQPLAKKQNFTLKITVAKKYYAISYGNEGELIRYAHQLPLWAVEYITVTGLKQPEKGCQKLITIFPLDNDLNNNCSHGLLMLEFGGRNGKWDHESKSINLTAEETKRMEGKTQLFVQIKNYGYFYVFTVGDPRQPVVKNTFWPDQWKQGKGIGNGNASLHVEASRMVGGIVEVIDSEPLDSAMIPPRSFKLTKAVANGTVITFRAKVDENANWFKIWLLHDAPEYHFYVGATVMVIEANFTEPTEDKKGIVKWKSYSNGKEHQIGTKNNSLFEAGKVFECRLEITQQDDQQKSIQIGVVVDGEKIIDFEGNLPIWTLNWMQTEGDIKLFQEPLYEFANEETNLFKRELEHLLYHGDELCIQGNVENATVGVSEFFIYLFHEANEMSDQIGDVVLQIRYDKTDEDIRLDSLLHETMEFGNSTLYTYISLSSGQRFHFKIQVAQNKYLISSHGSKSQVYEDTRIPPWAANWLVIDGGVNVKFGADNDLCAGAGQKPLPVNILQLYPNNLLDVGNQIVVQGKVGNAELIEVFLFREALEWNRIIGQTVLRVQLIASTITFNSYIPKTWAFPEEGNATNSRPIGEKLVEGQQFLLKIFIEGKQKFNIHYDGADGPLIYEQATLPIWAAQYIVVMGLKEPTSEESALVKIE